MIRRVIAAIGAALLLTIGLAPVTNANTSTDLSPAAAAAFSDVGRCLVSTKEPKLSVFYLIDNSGSLQWTDPDNERRGILEGSILELGSFIDQGIDVQVAATFFSTNTVPAFDWTKLNSSSEASEISKRLASQIDNELTGGSTDWEEGLRVAYEQLQSTGDSCKMLIWFTDGGINPDNTDSGREESLAALCRPGVGLSSLGAGTNYGLMSDFRKAQIPVFGVLYSNLDNALEYFRQESPSEADDILAREKWLMSFMKPLVEGRGEIDSQSFEDKQAIGGQLECADLLSDGTAPPEQTNGAYLNATDPVALAYQFMKLSTSISGGFGSQIVDGKFLVPPGTAKFVVIVAGQQWSLNGPEGSEIQASAGNPSGEVRTRESAGATSLEVLTVANPPTFGEWLIDTSGSQAELFLYSGLTFTLDRDRSSKILSEYPNTITGRIVRTREFDGYPINLDDYPEAEISVAIAEGGSYLPISGLEIEKLPSGEFSLANFVPPANLENLGVRLRLGLGGQFAPVESDFELVVQDKNALARATTDNIKLSPLIGPDGAAQGTLILEGPNTAPTSEFCFAEQIRIEDTQTGIEKVERVGSFTWTFTDQGNGQAGPCFMVEMGEQLSILVSATNPTQADSEVISVWNITAKTEGVDAQFEAPIRFSFESQVVTNQAVTLGVLLGLMILGLLLPLLAMWLLNFFTTRFLDVDNTVRAVIPVSVNTTGTQPLFSDARVNQERPWSVGTRDFLNVLEEKSPRTVDTGFGSTQARVPLFPLAATWYEWVAPVGSRILTHNLNASKRSKQFDSHRAVEVSPNMADNWAIVMSDIELLKPDTSDKNGNLIIYAPAGTIPSYEARISKILNSPGLKESIRSAAMKAQEQIPEPKSKKPNSRGGPDAALPDSPTKSNLPNIPGFTQSGSSQPGSSGTLPPNIPGFGSGGSAPGQSPSTPPNIPGFGSSPGSTGSTQKPPWLKD